MVVLDTSIIINHLRQRTKHDSPLIHIVKEQPKEKFAISMITVQELYEGRSTKNEQEEQAMLATIGSLKILPYTYEVAQLAGKIARDLAHPIELADAAIAATAVVNGYELATLNRKDFAGIEDLEFTP